MGLKRILKFTTENGEAACFVLKEETMAAELSRQGMVPVCGFGLQTTSLKQQQHFLRGQNTGS